jgi:hypothetical protein
MPSRRVPTLNQTNNTALHVGMISRRPNDSRVIEGHWRFKYNGIASLSLVDVIGEATEDIWQSRVPLVPVVPSWTG